MLPTYQCTYLPVPPPPDSGFLAGKPIDDIPGWLVGWLVRGGGGGDGLAMVTRVVGPPPVT